VSMRFATFCPAVFLGLSGAYMEFPSAYRGRCVGSNLSLGLDFDRIGEAVAEVGKGGNAQSMFTDKSGDGGRIDRGIGLVTLLFI
jgi:hypothetical protein